MSRKLGASPACRARRRRAPAAAAAAAALVALSAVSAAGASTPQPFADGSGPVQPVTVPLGLQQVPVTVMVQLKGDPVTVADANAPGGLSPAQKDALKSQLKAQQAPVAQQVQALGGTVLGSYQSVYNGIKVEIAPAQAGALASISGVTGVHLLRPVEPDNTNGVPLVGAPTVWAGLAGLHGEGIKIADIDTGIDYTHADFGGSGNPADYAAARASDTLAPNPLWFGPAAPKVKGGIDLVGDAYDASAKDPALTVPHPDPNPLDCNGHGTHTAGTAAGFGVLLDGSTYHGAYDAGTVSGNSWLVGPGVAPKADIYAVRVFGCSGSTNMVVDALEWSVDHGMDVVNMSLGSPFGGPDDPDAVASTNAAKDGVIVIASSGNSGPAAYITGSPASSTGAVSVAATDATASYPGDTLALSTGKTVTAIDANGIQPAGAGPYNVRVVWTDATHTKISLGCSVAADTAAGPIAPNTYIVVARGTCARVAKAIFGQQAGAAGVIMVNNSSALPPYEGPITANPDDGVPYVVTIPFLGVKGTSSTVGTMKAADGGTLTATPTTLLNPGYKGIASFSSWGPAADGTGKPNVIAPGVSVASAGMGTGTGFVYMSGTSMAAPHTTGTAALVKQAHPSWKKVRYWEAAIENTADPAQVNGFAYRGSGIGLIQAQNAARSSVVALGTDQTATLNYGFNELNADFGQTRTITLKNFGSSDATFAVSDAADAGSPHSVSVPSTVTVPAGGEASVDVTLSVPVATAGEGTLPLLQPFNDVSGLVSFTPVSGSNAGVALHVPYYMVPQGLSKVRTQAVPAQIATGTATATTTNNGAVAGYADWYDWGISDPTDRGLGPNDVRAVGVQSFPAQGYMQFAISTYQKWTNATTQEFDVYVDTTADGKPDFDVVAVDYGALTGGSANGMDVVFVFPIKPDGTFGPGVADYYADAPTDSSTIVMPVDFSLLGLTSGSPRFAYSVTAFNLLTGSSDSTSAASFDAFGPAVSSGMYDLVAPGAAVTESLTVNADEQKLTPSLGWMVVTHENKAGADEAQLIGLR